MHGSGFGIIIWFLVPRLGAMIDAAPEAPVAASTSRGLTRELLRWRNSAAQLYVSPERNSDRHRKVFRVLLQLVPTTAQQIVHLLPTTPVCQVPSFD